MQVHEIKRSEYLRLLGKLDWLPTNVECGMYESSIDHEYVVVCMGAGFGKIYKYAPLFRGFDNLADAVDCVMLGEHFEYEKAHDTRGALVVAFEYEIWRVLDNDPDDVLVYPIVETCCGVPVRRVPRVMYKALFKDHIPLQQPYENGPYWLYDDDHVPFVGANWGCCVLEVTEHLSKIGAAYLIAREKTSYDGLLEFADDHWEVWQLMETSNYNYWLNNLLRKAYQALDARDLEKIGA